MINWNQVSGTRLMGLGDSDPFANLGEGLQKTVDDASAQALAKYDRTTQLMFVGLSVAVVITGISYYYSRRRKA